MNPLALQKALEKLERARAARDKLSSVKNLSSYKSAWEDFLVAYVGVYSSLQQGSKGYAKSEGWFSYKKGEQKRDPLLAYLYHARNAEQHGIDPVVTEQKERWVFSDGQSDLGTIEDVMPDRNTRKGRFNSTTLSGDLSKATEIRIYPRQPNMAPVSDRQKRVHPVPNVHLGKPIEHGATLGDVTELVFTYLEKMVSEAKAL